MTGVKSHKLSRRERAQASRRKLLDAARDSFIESGYHGATMADIAARSGLAVQTVSYFFGTKPKLLNSLMRDTIETAIAESTPRGTAEWNEPPASATSGAQIVDHFVDIGHGILLAVAPLVDVARIGGLTDDEVAAVFEFHEDWRARDYARFVGWLAEAGTLRPGLDPRTATDIALTVFGPEVYLALTAGRGWEAAAIREGMGEMLKRLLLAPEHAA